jgi:hypothetical protein
MKREALTILFHGRKAEYSKPRGRRLNKRMDRGVDLHHWLLEISWKKFGSAGPRMIPSRLERERVCV